MFAFGSVDSWAKRWLKTACKAFAPRLGTRSTLRLFEPDERVRTEIPRARRQVFAVADRRWKSDNTHLCWRVSLGTGGPEFKSRRSDRKINGLAAPSAPFASRDWCGSNPTVNIRGFVASCRLVQSAKSKRPDAADPLRQGICLATQVHGILEISIPRTRALAGAAMMKVERQQPCILSMHSPEFGHSISTACRHLK
jgi:hypothetical protein